MIEKIEDLDFKDATTIEELQKIVIDKLGISFSEMTQSICSFVQDKAEELSQEFSNIIPYGQYDKIIEDNDGMAEFLRSDCTKEENWKCFSIYPEKDKPMLEFVFKCSAVDDGDELKGFVFVSYSGKIRHAFAQAEG